MAESSTPQGYDMANDPKRKAKSNDPGWKYGFWPELGIPDKVQCSLCGKVVRSGIKRLKQHLAGNYGDVVKCPKTTTAIMTEMREALLSKKRNNPVPLDGDDDVEVEVEGQRRSSTNPSVSSNAASNTVPSSGTASKKSKTMFQFPKPLLVVLRLVDGDEKPAMPEIYAAMDFAKKKIKNAYDNKPRLYKKVIDIIEKRWENQMEQSLYGAALFLNPGQFFDIKEKDDILADKLRDDFNTVLKKMVHDVELADKISCFADDYYISRGAFADDMSKRQRKIKNPLDWWQSCGVKTYELKRFATRILGLCCTSSGCERNWSTFEFIHTKKRNKLEHQRLNDLVYIQYNRRIVSRFQKRKALGKNFDPIVLEEFDWGNEWINHDGEVVHPGEDLTWNDVDIAMGATAATQGRNLPRGRGRRGSTSREPTLVDSDSDAEEDTSGRGSESGCDEESFFNDDMDVEDDFGARPPPTPTNDENDDLEGGGALPLDETFDLF